MSLPDTPPLSLFRAADLSGVVPASTELRRELRAGTLVRLRRGVYLASTEWNALDRDDRYRASVRAVALSLGPDAVFSHQSAAALWGLPIVGPWPAEVHLLVDRATGGRSDPGMRRHALGVTEQDFTTIDNIRVTTLARTVIDIAATASLYSAVATADAAIHAPRFGPPPRLTKNDLSAEWERMLPFRGYARARRIVDFAETQSGSTSESTSRVTIALLGLPAPELQRVYLVGGRELPVDFYWDGVDGIGECDGLDKYSNPRLRAGKSIEQVVIDEKLREDALRRQAAGFTRWGSAEAMNPALLRVKLLELGLRQGAPRLRGR